MTRVPSTAVTLVTSSLARSLFARSLFATMLLFATMAPTAQGQETAPAQTPPVERFLDFEEEFALSDDRAALLAKLVPGTEEHFYYSSLVALQAGELGEVQRLLSRGRDRHRGSDRYTTIEHRHALARAATHPDETRAYLRDKLRLRFDDRQPNAPVEIDRPTRLDPSRSSREAWARYLFERVGIAGFRKEGLRDLAKFELTDEQRRALLHRIELPDYPGLVALIVAELQDRDSAGFGHLNVHHRLTLAQLEEIADLHPEVLNAESFVVNVIARLAPADATVDFDRDRDELDAYLRRFVEFSRGLGPNFTDVKVHALYHRLRFDRARGIFDRALFLEYLEYPRDVKYLRPEFIVAASRRAKRASLNIGSRLGGLMPAVRHDWELVRDYLTHFMLADDGHSAFEKFLPQSTLQRVFAEAKLLADDPDRDRWARFYYNDANALQRLRDRVEITFAPTNPTYFSSDDPIELTVDIKNLGSLLVRVFEINTANYYREHQREVDPTVPLDGLIANYEESHTFGVSPWLRERRVFEFPNLSRPGVYVIEFIGKGRAIRALVHKGRLNAIQQPGAAGHVFTVVDDLGQRVSDATLSISGHDYSADEHGRVLVPYTNDPGRRTFTVARGDGPDAQVSLGEFDHQRERYTLRVQLAAVREALIEGATVQLPISAELWANGVRLPLDLLQDANLSLSATDASGVVTRVPIDAAKLVESGEVVHSFVVPPRLLGLSVKLRGRVNNLSRRKPEEVTDSTFLQLNGIAASPVVDDVHFVASDAGYRVELRGKTGEPRPGRALRVALEFDGLAKAYEAEVRTDDEGGVELGSLEGVAVVRVDLGDGRSRQWSVPRDRCRYPEVVHAGLGETIQLPYAGSARRVSSSDFALVQQRTQSNGTKLNLADHVENLSVRSGFLTIRDLSAGDYALHIKEQGLRLNLRIARGVRVDDTILGEGQALESPNIERVHIVSVEAQPSTVEVLVSKPGSTVDVVATRFVSEARVVDRHRPAPKDWSLPVTNSTYLGQRDLGDEYRYILDRRERSRYATHPLDRPGLLLNPWALAETTTRRFDASGGESWDDVRRVARPEGETPSFFGMEAVDDANDSPNYDFLGMPAVVRLKLVADNEGRIRIPRSSLEGRPFLRVRSSHTERHLRLPTTALSPRDLTLRQPLDVSQNFAESKRVVPLGSGQPLDLADDSTASFEPYTTLGDVFELYSILTDDPHLRRFEFLLRWPSLDEAEKLAKYSEFACHELHLFIARKDPNFFARYVGPHLENKRHPTFMDRYLLGRDVSSYLDPWAYDRLNALEQTLLAGALSGDAARSSARSLRDRARANRLPVDEFHRRFRTAIGRRSLSQPVPEATPKPNARPTREKRNKSARRKPGFLAPKLALDEEEQRSAQSRRDRSLIRMLDSALYLPPIQTQELAESDYYRVQPDYETSALVRANTFWADYAMHLSQNATAPFVSSAILEATTSFTEMAAVLAVLDLPFDSAPPSVERKDGRRFVSLANPSIAFVREVRVVDEQAATQLLIDQNYFRADARTEVVDGEERAKYHSGEFLPHVVYGCQIVVTNPSQRGQRADLLIQIPSGAIPVADAFQTRGRSLELAPYATEAIEYLFYFPRLGQFEHFPVHVALDGVHLTAAASTSLAVVEQRASIDAESWEDVAARADTPTVLTFLESRSLERLDLSRVAWRLVDPASFASFGQPLLDLLRSRHVYDSHLWSYGLLHGDDRATREYLRHRGTFLEECNSWVDTPWVRTDPIELGWLEHLEYAPLINARAHPLGDARRIANQELGEQYRSLLQHLAQKPQLSDRDWLDLASYLLLQDRIDFALAAYDRVDADRVTTRIQYDYLAAIVALHRDDLATARRIGETHADYPIHHWNRRFRQLTHYLDGAAGRLEPGERGEESAPAELLADRAPAFDFEIDGNQVRVNHRNLDRCRINYYPTDVELLFSNQPFVSRTTQQQWAAIRPTHSETFDLPGGEAITTLAIPPDLITTNSVIEIVAGGQRASKARYANSLDVQVVQQQGRVIVRDATDQRPLAKTYVKVYAATGNSPPRFYKDGYTDLRGRFDYASLTGGDTNPVTRFAILVHHDESGATIREVAPPAR